MCKKNIEARNTLLKKANKAFRDKLYNKALDLYIKAKKDDPFIGRLVDININITEKRTGLPDKGQKLDFNKNRIAVFASYSPDGYLPSQVIPYLKGLRVLAKKIVVVFDNEISADEIDQLKKHVDHIITGRHGEYDFGSYKRGYKWLKESNALEDASDLIFCNDSCYGPVGSFIPMFNKMEARKLDFWGVTESHEISYHLQSYFVVFSKSVFNSIVFQKFIDGIEQQSNVQQVIIKYEIGMTKCLMEADFKCEPLIFNKKGNAKDPTYRNLTLHNMYLLEKGCPLVKVKALVHARCSVDGPNRILKWLKENDQDIYSAAANTLDIKRFEDADAVSFSIIMPTKNRKHVIESAIKSVLKQSHQNYELVIIDDGSTDGTKDFIEQKFNKDIQSGRIKYVNIPVNLGVCRARNIGISYAKNSWIAYLDSDNEMREFFLTVFANSIIEYPNSDTFYGRAINKNSGEIIGRAFDRQSFLKDNFIDLGTFVHRASLVEKHGGFDPSLNRLVDWDLIIKMTKEKDPHYIQNMCFLGYEDRVDDSRISMKESFIKAKVAVSRKHSSITTVTTAILSYNQKDYIQEAIESAINQTGGYIHEVIISDDCSTDGTRDIVKEYAKKYPHLIRDISPEKNIGVSNNYCHCFAEAQGELIAILEGDDYWIDPEKNLKQSNFLNERNTVPAVFSKIKVLDMKSKGTRTLKRQEGLKSLISGEDFAKNECLNLIANFSSVMIRSKMAKNIPSIVFSPRINEICLAFYLEQHGKIGFIDEIMGVYRLNTTSVWTGASQISQLEQSIAIRKNALCIAKPQYKEKIKDRLKEKEKELNNHRLKAGGLRVTD